MESVFAFERFESNDPRAFAGEKPFPFLCASDSFLPGAREQLLAGLPRIERFRPSFGKKRRAGQLPHDRYSLEYTPELDPMLDPSWRTLLAELRSDRYRRHVCRLLGVRSVSFRFHWHYTPPGCSVSPHVDQSRELGSHIFYLNSPQWQDQWGGQTLLLGAARPPDRSSAPSLEAFDSVTECPCRGDRSLLFRSGPATWHAVREVACPEGEMRRVFIVVFNSTNPYWRVRDRVIGKHTPRY